MSGHHQKENAPAVDELQEHFYADGKPEMDGSKTTARERDSASDNATSWAADIEQTVQLGEQFVEVIAGVVDLARAEALLAIQTLPKLMMLWLIIMPVMLLTWCAFSALTAWSVFAASGQVGLGMLTFFLQQVLLLLVCRWLFVKYRTRMTLPYTRAQIENFVRSTQHGFEGKDKTKE